PFFPPPIVSIAATDPAGSEVGADPIAFTVTRTGSLAAALPVNLVLEGGATLDDFGVADTALVIPAGQAAATLTLVPVADGKVEGTEVARLRLVDGAGYVIDTAHAAAEATVADADQPPPPT